MKTAIKYFSHLHSYFFLHAVLDYKTNLSIECIKKIMSAGLRKCHSAVESNTVILLPLRETKLNMQSFYDMHKGET